MEFSKKENENNSKVIKSIKPTTISGEIADIDALFSSVLEDCKTAARSIL